MTLDLLDLWDSRLESLTTVYEMFRVGAKKLKKIKVSVKLWGKGRLGAWEKVIVDVLLRSTEVGQIYRRFRKASLRACPSPHTS